MRPMRNTVLSCILIIITIVVALADFQNVTEPNADDTLSLLLMGDTQFHFMCEEDNVQCKHVSKRCRLKYSLPIGLDDFGPGVEPNETLRQGRDLCIRIESRFANRVQRQALEYFITNLDHKPAALIINGDLTNFGHLHQLTEFKKVWYTNFSIPLLLGLGNHDYQNNIDDCPLNFCAHTMLSWYAEYVKNSSLSIDLRRQVKNGFEVSYTGSLAYTERICSSSGKTCAFVVQLNNAIDYSVSFSSLFVEWKLSSPMEYLRKELDILMDTDLPILLNMHKCENLHIHKLKMMLTRWLSNAKTNFESNQKVPRIGVFYAHMHQRHEVHLHCIAGFKVPFVYVGSVPNNRFSWFSMNSTHAHLTGYKARDHLIHNGTLLESLDGIALWGPCTVSEHKILADHATKKRWLNMAYRQKYTSVNSTFS